MLDFHLENFHKSDRFSQIFGGHSAPQLFAKEAIEAIGHAHDINRLDTGIGHHIAADLGMVIYFISRPNDGLQFCESTLMHSFLSQKVRPSTQGERHRMRIQSELGLRHILGDGLILHSDVGDGIRLCSDLMRCGRPA